VIDLPRSSRFSIRVVVLPVITTLVALVLSVPALDLGPVSLVAAFMLSVTVAAVGAGLWGGLIAAVLASIIVPILEEPDLVLRIDEPRDIVAATVFFAIAVVVGIVVGSAADERARAARREREARLLATLSARLFSGDVPERVLDELVELMIEPLALGSCTADVVLDGHPLHARAESAVGDSGGPSETVPIAAGGTVLGSMTVVRPARGRALTREERQLLEAAASQAGAAVDRARLDARARLAQVDAETNLLRASMFSSVTHDLRTPLASIKAGVTSLLDESAPYTDQQRRDLLLTILEETDRLNRLVGNILDLAKIRAGALIPRRSPAAIDEVVETVVGRLRGRFTAADTDVTIELTMPPSAPDIPADAVQIDQVLTNLLENAVRHSPRPGVVHVGLSVIPRGVRIRVIDQGPGIAPDDREKVFEAFYRGDELPESSGTGLGLAIAKAIVVAHGGRLWVEDGVNGGAAFVCELPLEEGVSL
jgi:two-component system sensor histidine kinase KdpD